MSSDLFGALLATLAALFFGINVIIIRKITVTEEPLDSVIATLWVSVLIFAPISIIFHYPSYILTTNSFLAFAVAGLLGAFLGRTCYYYGTKRVGASRTVPISRGNLLVASFLGVLILHESISAGHLLGIFILVVGIAVVGYEMGSRNSEIEQKSRIDFLLPFGSMLFVGLARPFGKIGLSQGVPVTMGLTIRFSVPLLVLIGYFLWKGNSPFRPFKSEKKWLYLSSGLVISIAFAFFYAALSISRIVVAVPFQGLTPFFALILSYSYLQDLEKITKLLVLGSILVVAGAIMTGIYM